MPRANSDLLLPATGSRRHLNYEAGIKPGVIQCAGVHAIYVFSWRQSTVFC